MFTPDGALRREYQTKIIIHEHEVLSVLTAHMLIQGLPYYYHILIYENHSFKFSNCFTEDLRKYRKYSFIAEQCLELTLYYMFSVLCLPLYSVRQ